MSDDKQFEENDETFDIKPNTNVQIILENQEDKDDSSDSDPIAQIVRQNDNSHELDGDIHMFKKARSGKKCDTIIIGLIFPTQKENNDFLKKIKTKFGTGGCHKEMPELAKNSLVFVFTGDCREKIRKLLVAEYGKDIKNIKIHG